MTHFLIDGELTGALAGETLPVEDPSTGQILRSVPLGRPADAELAIAAARRAFDAGPWPQLSPAERGAALQRLSEALEANRDEFVAYGEDEVGTARPPRRGRGHHPVELPAALEHLEGGPGAAHREHRRAEALT